MFLFAKWARTADRVADKVEVELDEEDLTALGVPLDGVVKVISYLV